VQTPIVSLHGMLGKQAAGRCPPELQTSASRADMWSNLFVFIPLHFGWARQPLELKADSSQRERFDFAHVSDGHSELFSLRVRVFLSIRNFVDIKILFLSGGLRFAIGDLSLYRSLIWLRPDLDHVVAKIGCCGRSLAKNPVVCRQEGGPSQIYAIALVMLLPMCVVRYEVQI